MAVKMNIPSSAVPSIFAELDGKGHKYAVVSTKTEPKTTKKHRVTKQTLQEFLGADVVSLVKESEAIYSIGSDYENMVNNKLDKEGYEKNFETGKLPWGEWVEGSKILLIHNGEYYFRMYPVQNNALAAKCKEVNYFKVLANGSEVEVTEDELKGLYEGFLDKPKEKATLVEGGTLDGAKPMVTTFKAKSITGLRVDGIDYTVKG